MLVQHMAPYQEEDGDGDVTTTHATLGQRVIVSELVLLVGAGIGYTGTPPGGNIPVIVEHMIPIIAEMRK